MKPITDTQSLVRGAVILTGSMMIVKILSAVYRVPFQNIVGDVGFYIYQQVYPFYGGMLILATQGFPVVISKLYKEYTVDEFEEKGFRILALSFVFISIISSVLFFSLYFGAEVLAAVMGDKRLSPLFQIIAFPFLLLPFTAVIRGGFQGRGNMVPTAISQVVEQLVRVVTILVLSSLFIHFGYSLYRVGSGAVFGAVTGGLTGLVVLASFFVKSKDFLYLKKLRVRELFTGAGPIFRALAIQGLAISISGMVLILMQLADALNVYQLLVKSGMEEQEAKIVKGIFDRGQPLIQLGTVVATSIALTIVPAISGRKQKHKKLNEVRSALQMSVIVGLGAAIGLFSIIEPTNMMLFENNKGSSTLALLSLTILPASILITIVGILQGFNHTLFSALMILIGFSLKYGLNVLLVPIWGIKGAASASIIALSIAFVILFWKLKMELQMQLLPLQFIGKSLLASGIMGLFLHMYLKWTNMQDVFMISERMAASMQAVSAVVLGAILYLVLVIKMSLLKKAELSLFPYGSKLLFLLPKKTGDD